ncbi:transmembrane protein 160 [Carcharodon carcharias]|uniref:transmembrane protein 160 n=1 Tax=Carcharodon carcharias TaxID=13397 RepID=UPI001B7EE7CE|nr:transmembrane protein 160 [Carcharodon carcharias]
MASFRALGALRRYFYTHFARRRFNLCSRSRSQSQTPSQNRAGPRAGTASSGTGHPGVTELDRADAWMLRKAHETGFLSWFRNGLLATGVGVISYMQSDTGREAAYGFFILGGVCISYGSGSYVANLFLLRRMMMLSVPTALVSGLVVGAVALFWLCAVSLYIGRLEVEIIHDEECEDCKSKEDKSKSDK